MRSILTAVVLLTSISLGACDRGTPTPTAPADPVMSQDTSGRITPQSTEPLPCCDERSGPIGSSSGKTCTPC